MLGLGYWFLDEPITWIQLVGTVLAIDAGGDGEGRGEDGEGGARKRRRQEDGEKDKAREKEEGKKCAQAGGGDA